MMLIEFLKANDIMLSDKGTNAMAKALRDIFEPIDDGIDDETLVGRILTYDFDEEVCLQILQLTAKYAKLWIFS